MTITLTGSGADAHVISGPAGPFVVQPRAAANNPGGASPFAHPWKEHRNRLAGIGFGAGRFEPPSSCRAEDEIPGIINYYLGDDAKLWRPALRRYASLRCVVTPSIDVLQMYEETGIRYRIIVRPPTDPATLLFSFETNVAVDEAGDLTGDDHGTHLRYGALRVTQPLGATSETLVGARWKVSGYNQAQVMIDAYDRTLDTTIELDAYNVLETDYFTTPVFGSGPAVAIDGEGNIYAAALSSTMHRGELALYPGDIYAAQAVTVQKFKPDGELVYTTFFGGLIPDPRARFVLQPDDAGNVWIAGISGSRFPRQTCARDCEGVFALKLGPRGEMLDVSYATGLSDIRAMAVGRNGTIAVTGRDSRFNPTADALPAKQDVPAYVALVRPGRGVTFGTRLAGLEPAVLAVTNSGAIVLGGMVVDQGSPLLSSPDVPGYQKLPQGGISDGFVLVLDPREKGMKMIRGATYLGGAGGFYGFDHEAVTSVAVDAAEKVTVAGFTGGAFPNQGKGPRGAGRDVFVARLNRDLSHLDGSYVFGGKDDDLPYGVAVDASSNSWIAGLTKSPDFPRVRAIEEVDAGPHVFVAKLNSVGTALVASTFAGRGGEGAYSIAADASGGAWIGTISGNMTTPVASPLAGVQATTVSGVMLLHVGACSSCPPPPEIGSASRSGEMVVLEGKHFASGARVVAGTKQFAARIDANRVHVDGVPERATEISIINPDKQSATIALPPKEAMIASKTAWLAGAGGALLVIIALVTAGRRRKRWAGSKIR